MIICILSNYSGKYGGCKEKTGRNGKIRISPDSPTAGRRFLIAEYKIINVPFRIIGGIHGSLSFQKVYLILYAPCGESMQDSFR
jgi:hypothetical protein